MARIRTIKPEFFTSEQIVECSTNARLLFVGMWCFADDGGIHPASVKRLKMEVFPADPFSVGEIEAMVGELIRADLLTLFEADGREFWAINGWRHQKIDRPNPKYPTPAQGRILSEKRDEHSTSIRREIDESSPLEGKGTVRELEGKGRGKEAPPPSPRKRGVVLLNVPADLPTSIDTPEVRTAIGEWIAHRAEKRKPLTPLQLSKLVDRLVGMGPSRAVHAVNHSIAGGYDGLFEPPGGHAAGEAGDVILDSLRQAKENRERTRVANGV